MLGGELKIPSEVIALKLEDKKAKSLGPGEIILGQVLAKQA